MNNTIENFLRNNDVYLDILDSDIFTIKSDSEINPILGRYYIPGKHFKKYISIANILGFSYDIHDLSQSLIENLSYFFDSEGTTYQKRSVGMTTMDREKCLETLKRVSSQDTVYVRECENNKYTITDNGLHRFHILRFHYINELSKIDENNTEQIKHLESKYTIPVEVQQTDYVKTYCYFILKKLIPEIRISADYNDNYELTGNSVVKIGDKQKVLSDEELINFLKRAIEKYNSKLNDYIYNFEYYIEILPTFKSFLEDNTIDLFSQEALV